MNQKKKTNNSRLRLRGFIAGAVIVATIGGFFLVSDTGSADSVGNIKFEALEPITELDTTYNLLHSVEVDENKVNVSSAFGNIEYSSSFVDALQIIPKQEKEQNILEFQGVLAYGTYTTYTFIFDSDSIDALGRITDDNGNPFYVHLKMAEPPEGLSKSDLDTFYAVQETVNDVLDSLLP